MALADLFLTFSLMQELVFSKGDQVLRLLALTLAGYMPALVAGPVFGAFLDRRGGRRLPLFINLFRAFIVLILAYAIHTGAGPLLILSFYIMDRFAGQAHIVIRLTLFSLLSPASSLVKLNAIRERIFFVICIAGPPLAGIMVVSAGRTATLTVAAIAFFLAALVLGRGPDAVLANDGTGYWKSIGQGVRAVNVVKGMPRIFILNFMIVIGAGLVSFGTPLLIARALPAAQGAKELGFLNGGFNLGSVGATFLLTIFCGRFGEIGFFRASICLCALSCFALLLPMNKAGFALAFIILGLVSQPGFILLSSWTQALAPDGCRGRLLALNSGLQAGGFLAASMIGSLAHYAGGINLLLSLAALFMIAGIFVCPKKELIRI